MSAEQKYLKLGMSMTEPMIMAEMTEMIGLMIANEPMIVREKIRRKSQTEIPNSLPQELG